MEQNIKIAAKLYQCRDTAKTLAKFNNKDYKEMLEPYLYIIRKVMASNNLDEISSLLKISKTKTYNSSKFAPVLFMAATVELIEPSI